VVLTNADNWATEHMSAALDPIPLARTGSRRCGQRGARTSPPRSALQRPGNGCPNRRPAHQAHRRGDPGRPVHRHPCAARVDRRDRLGQQDSPCRRGRHVLGRRRAWPASDPLVTAVGGTRLHLDDHGRRTALDQVWTDEGGVATGAAPR
jgi:hypothetical protein